MHYDLNLRDYFRILRRRKGIVILVPLLFAVASFGFALLQAPKPVYQATAVVRIERAVSVTVLLQELFTYNPVGNVETQAALITGFPVMSAAAKKLRLIPADASPDEIRASPALFRAVENLSAAVTPELLAGTSLIEISVSSSDPDRAALVANTVAEAFREDNFQSRSRQAREAREFIERQLEEVGARLQHAEGGLKAFKESNRILVFTEEMKESLRRLATLKEKHDGIQSVIRRTEEELALLRNGASLPRPTSFPADGVDPVVKAYGSLSELTLRRDNLLLTLLPSHPEAKQLQAEIANLRGSLTEALGSRLRGLQVRGDELHREIVRLEREQAAIPAAEINIARLEREVKVAERMFSMLKEKHQEALIREKEQVSEVSLVRPAVASRQPINPPQAPQKAAVGLVIGLLMGFVLAFVVEALDTSVGAIDDVESFLQVPVLGVIPHLDVKDELSEKPWRAVVLDAENQEKHAFLMSLFLPDSRAVEAVRALRTNLLFSGFEQDLKTIMVTSATPTEGKTTVAINLAIVLAQLGKRTLLIEADLRNPFLHHAFGIPKEPGLTDVVIGSASLDESVLRFSDLVLGRAGLESLIDRPGTDNLALLPSGAQPPNPTEFLSSQALANLLVEVRDRYDYVLLDCAPTLPVADAAIVGSRVDGVLLVVRVGSVARAALRRAKALLEAARARFLGVCLTGVKADVSPDYAEMGYYPYRYGGARQTRPATARRSLPWSGRLKVDSRSLVLGLLLLLAIAAGVWAWREGHLNLPPKLPSLSSVSSQLLDTARTLDVVRPARWARSVPDTLSRALAALVDTAGPPATAAPPPVAPTGAGRTAVARAAPMPTAAPPPAAPPGAGQLTAARATPRPVPAPAPEGSPGAGGANGMGETAPGPEPGPPAGGPAARPLRYALELRAFSGAEEAERAVERYRKAGLPAFSVLNPVSWGGRGWHVLVGEFQSPKEAEAFGWDLLVAARIDEFRVVERPREP